MIDFRNADGSKFTDARAAAFRAIFDRLKTDKVLSRVITKFSTAAQDPTTNELPYMQVRLVSGANKVHSPSTYETTLSVEIAYAVNAAGADEETAAFDIINLYAHIEKAFSLVDVAWIRDAIQKVDANAVVRTNPTITIPGFTSTPLPNINALAGKSILTMSLKIDTCRS